jgi:prepilin-type N-terminal cleavage/methylation domain-containing protein
MKRFLRQMKIAISRRGERGFSLLESLVAIAILGGGALTLILAMSSGALAVNVNDEQSVAQSLARTQLEYIKGQDYDAGASAYPLVSAPEGYSISVSVSAVPGAVGNIQKITVNVARDEGTIMTTEDYKVNR